MSDKLVFDLSQEVEGSASIFVKKDYINILDNMNSVYNSNQSIIDTSQLSNSNKYVSYREAYLAVPMLLTLATTSLATAANFAPATALTSADYAIGLKSWFGQMIHSFTLDMNGTTIIQQTPFIQMINSFQLLTSLSWGDVATQGASMGFYPDNPLSFSFQAAPSTSGRGVCNNSNFASNAFQTVVTGVFNSYNSANGNTGLLKRQQYINYDPEASSGSSTFGAAQLSAGSCNLLWKSYVFNKINGVNATNQGVFQINLMGFIQLKHVHSFFNFIPLLKGAFMKMTLNLNNTTVDYSVDATDLITLNSVSNAVGGVCPLMIASAAANNGGVAAYGGVNTFRANVSVGATCLDPQLASIAGVQQGRLARSIYLYVPCYSFNPIFESAYLSSPIKQIKYTDVYQYQINNIPASTGQINNLVTNGIAGLVSVTILPYYSAATNNIIGAGASPLPAYQSPFDPAGCGPTSPLCLLTNFNVVVSGQNMIYNTVRYSFETWLNQVYGANAVDGGMVDGLSSGLIDQLGWEMEYCYHHVDVSRMLPVEESVPKSVQIIGQNTSARDIDLFVFCTYRCSVSVDVLSGSRVA